MAESRQIKMIMRKRKCDPPDNILNSRQLKSGPRSVFAVSFFHRRYQTPNRKRHVLVNSSGGCHLRIHEKV